MGVAWGAVRLIYARFGDGRPLTYPDYWPLWVFPAILCVGLYLSIRPSTARQPRVQLRPVDEHWSEARPRFPYRERVALAALMAAVYNLTVLPASLHYLLSAATDRQTAGDVLASLAVLPGVALIVWAITRGLVLFRMRDAKLLINARSIVPGQEIHVKFVQQYLHTTHVDRARVGLLCARPPLACAFEAWKDLPVERDVAGGKRLRVSGKFHLPPNVHPTSPPGSKARCDWRFVLRMQLAHGPPYEAEFPVAVSPSSRALSETGSFAQ